MSDLALPRRESGSSLQDNSGLPPIPARYSVLINDFVIQYHRVTVSPRHRYTYTMTPYHHDTRLLAGGPVQQEIAECRTDRPNPPALITTVTKREGRTRILTTRTVLSGTSTAVSEEGVWLKLANLHIYWLANTNLLWSQIQTLCGRKYKLIVTKSVTNSPQTQPQIRETLPPSKLYQRLLDGYWPIFLGDFIQCFQNFT